MDEWESPLGLRLSGKHNNASGTSPARCFSMEKIPQAKENKPRRRSIQKKRETRARMNQKTSQKAATWRRWIFFELERMRSDCWLARTSSLLPISSFIATREFSTLRGKSNRKIGDFLGITSYELRITNWKIRRALLAVMQSFSFGGG